MTREFFEDAALPRFYTFSYIILILKVVDLISFERSRPISLCSVVYKIFSMIVVNHMTSCLIKIFFLEQVLFLPRRSIFEIISLEQEMMQVLNRKHARRNVISKVERVWFL